MKNKIKVIIASFIVFMLVGLTAFASPDQLTYQGRILKSDGQPLEYNNVSFIFEVTSENGLCVLYREQRDGLNMTNSKGVFDVPIGSGARLFPDAATFPSYKLSDSFVNGITHNCFGSGTWTSTGTSYRLLKVQFHDGMGWRQISPDNVIRSVPFAMTAKSATQLGDKTINDFILKTNAPGAACSAGQVVFWDGSNFSCVTDAGGAGVISDVLAGTGISVTGTTSKTVSVTFGTTAGTAAQGNDSRITNALQSSTVFAGDVTGTAATMSVDRIKGVVVDATAPTSGQVLKYDGAKWAAASPNAGTVTSVGVSVPSFLSVSGGPITSSGTISISLASQTANTVFAAPSGSNGTPSFRNLGIADINSSIGGLSFLNTAPSCVAGSALTYVSATDRIQCAVIAVDNANIANNAITTAKIADGAVTAQKLGNDVGAWGVSGSDIYRSSGKVGVGTNAPVNTLTVKSPNQNLAGTGTISYTIDSDEIVGTGTSFLSEVKPGDVIYYGTLTNLSGGHTVKSVNSDTSITMYGKSFATLPGNSFYIVKAISTISTNSGSASYSFTPSGLVTNLEISTANLSKVNIATNANSVNTTANGYTSQLNNYMTVDGTYYWRAASLASASQIPAGLTNSADLMGLNISSARNSSPGDMGTLGSNIGISAIYGHYNRDASTPTTNTVIGMRLLPQALTGQIKKQYDLYIAQPTGTPATTISDGVGGNYDHYAIYQASTAAVNYLGSPLAVGANAIPSASSILELNSTDKGFLLPRMTTAQRDAITSPATGLQVFNTNTNKINFYDGSSWANISDTDQSTYSGVSVITGGASGVSISAGGTNQNVTLTASGTGTVTTGSVMTVTNSTASTAYNNGALVVSGGVGVSGNINSNGNIYSTGTIRSGTAVYSPLIYGGTASSASLTLDSTSSVNKGVIAIAPSGGNVGIGTTTPTALIDIQPSSTSGNANSLNISSTTVNKNNTAIQVSSSSTNGTGYGIKIDTVANTNGTSYGIYLGNVTNNNHYGIYQNGTSPNFLNGNLGIGTSNPAEKLQVAGGTSNGSIRMSGRSDWIAGGGLVHVGSIYGHNEGANFTSTRIKLDGSDTQGMIAFYTSEAGGIGERMRISPAGFVGIGTASPQRALHISNGGLQISTDTVGNGVNDGFIINYFGDDMLFSNRKVGGKIGLGTNGFSDKLTIASSGNVGVGTTTPGALLTLRPGGAAGVQEAMRIIDPNTGASEGSYIRWETSDKTDQARAGLISGATGSSFYISTNSADTGTPTERIRILPNGDVGIGTSAPTQRLDVVGYIRAASGNTQSISIFENSGGKKAYFGVSSNGGIASGITTGDAVARAEGGTALHLATDGGKVTLNSAGSLGVGTVSPSYKLDVQGGDINASGSVRAAGVALSSDQRFKKNIEVITNPLGKILALRGVEYDWRRDEFPGRQFTSRHQVGVIAQDVEKVFPELVDTDKSGYKSVNYPALIAPVIGAIKELFLTPI